MDLSVKLVLFNQECFDILFGSLYGQGDWKYIAVDFGTDQGGRG